MNYTSKGNISTKKAPGMQHKRYMRIERLCRLELSGHTEDEMAFHQGISKVRVNQLKRTPEYISLRTQLASGIVSQADRNMLEDIDANHQIVKDMVPEALLAVRDAILDRNNPALRLRAAQDLLDREGTLAKVSKSEVKAHVEYDFAQHETVSNSLLDALKQTESGRTTILGNKQLDNIDNMDNADFDLNDPLGLKEFAKAGLNKDSTKNLQAAYDLIDAVDVSMEKRDEKPPTIN